MKQQDKPKDMSYATYYALQDRRRMMRAMEVLAVISILALLMRNPVREMFTQCFGFNVADSTLHCENVLTDKLGLFMVPLVLLGTTLAAIWTPLFLGLFVITVVTRIYLQCLGEPKVTL